MAQACANRVFVNVMEMCLVVAMIFDTAKRETWLPYAQFGFQPEGESSLDVLHGFFERDIFGRCNQKVDVVGHEDEGMEMIAAFFAIIAQCGEEKFGMRFDLKQPAAVCRVRGDKERPDFLRGGKHSASLA